MQVFADSARAQLVSYTSNSLVVSSGARFPVANRGTDNDLPTNTWFKLVLTYGTDYEICYVKTHTGNGTFTNVERGKEGTTARSWPVDKQQTAAFIAPVAADMTAILSAIATLQEAKLDAAAVGSAPDQVPSGQHLGKLAFQDALGAITTQRHEPDAAPGEVWLEQPGTTPTLKYRDPADSATKNLFDILVRDTYRMTVEAGSGGRQTVLYTAKGQPSIMNIIPAFNLEDIDPALGTGPHPMFIVGGVTKRERFIGTYPGSVVNGELLSVPGVDPAASRNFDSFVSAARANGSGWGIMTNADWAGIALWCWKNGFMPRGNTDYGRAHDALHETGRRQDGTLPGVTTGTARTLTGSGPVSWRHDNSATGIADLCGNVWEWAAGMRIVDGEIHIIANNDAALSSTDFSAESSAWKAVDGATGELVAPGHANAVKYAASGTAAYTLLALASGQSFEGMTNPGSTPVSDAALQVLKRAGLFPIANTGLGGDGFWHNLTDARLLIRGGAWGSGARTGVFALILNSLRSYTSADIGARPAFVL